MALRYRSRIPKKSRNKGLETAIKMLVYPPAIAAGILVLGIKKKRRKKK